MVSSRPPVASSGRRARRRPPGPPCAWPSSVATTDCLATSQTLTSPCAAGPVIEGASAGRQERAVGREGDALDRPAEVGEPGILRAGLDIPERDDIPFAGRGQQPAVGRERQLGDTVEPRQLVPAARRSRRPRSGSCRPSFPRRARSVGREDDRDDAPLVPVEVAFSFLVGQVPERDRAGARRSDRRRRPGSCRRASRRPTRRE